MGALATFFPMSKGILKFSYISYISTHTKKRKLGKSLKEKPSARHYSASDLRLVRDLRVLSFDLRDSREAVQTLGLFQRPFMLSALLSF
jgi:hypothetical protein